MTTAAVIQQAPARDTELGFVQGAVLGRFGANRRRALLALGDQGVISLANFLTGVIVGRACGKADLGVYMLAWTLLIFSIEISSALTATPYTVFGPRMRQRRRNQYLGNVLVHQVAFSALFALAVCCFAMLGVWLGLLSSNAAAVAASCGATMILMGLREFARRSSLAELKAGVAFSIDCAACALQLAGMFALLRWNVLTPARSYLVLAVSSGAGAAIWLIMRRAPIRCRISTCVRTLKENWLFAKWTLGSWALWTFVLYASPWLLAAVHGSESAGVWAACATIVALGNPVMLGLGNHVGPHISSICVTQGASAMARYVHRSALLFAALLLPYILVIAVFGQRLVSTVYGDGYPESGAVATLLALNLAFSAVTYPYSRGLLSLDRPKTDMLVNLFAVALLAVLAAASVGSYATLGAAGALALSSGVSTVLRIGFFAREARLRAEVIESE